MDVYLHRAGHVNHGRDRVALILATGVALFVVIAAVGISVQHDPLSEVGGNLLATVLGGMTGAVATYLGLTGHAPGDAQDGTPPPAPGDGDGSTPPGDDSSMPPGGEEETPPGDGELPPVSAFFSALRPVSSLNSRMRRISARPASSRTASPWPA